MALPQDTKCIKFNKVSCWTLLKAFVLCMFVAICSAVFNAVGCHWWESNSVGATSSALVATQNGDNYIWDTGASTNLMGVQSTVGLTDADKIMLDPPIDIDTAAGPHQVAFKVKAWCKPLAQ